MNIDFKLIRTFFNAMEYLIMEYRAIAMNILVNVFLIKIATYTSFSCSFVNTPLYP